jgi:GNAT superfamily N-acetyltransferase
MGAKDMTLEEMKTSQLGEVVEILQDAKRFLRQQNVDQWQGQYPDEEVIKEDMRNHNAYVLVDNGTVLGYSAVIFDKEPAYEEIYEGRWLNDTPYAALHRLMMHEQVRGRQASVSMMEEIKTLCKKRNTYHIRVDTHEDNIRMQKYLLKHGFVYCGIIYLADKNKRKAYECIFSSEQ